MNCYVSCCPDHPIYSGRAAMDEDIYRYHKCVDRLPKVDGQYMCMWMHYNTRCIGVMNYTRNIGWSYHVDSWRHMTLEEKKFLNEKQS